MDTLIVTLQLVLSAVLALAAVTKLQDLPGSRDAVHGFGVPRRYAHALGTLLPASELVLAVLILPAATARLAAVAAGLLFLVFIIAIGWNLRQGRQPDCHCFGQVHSEPAGWPTIARNAVLATMAAAVAWVGGVGPVDWFGGLSAITRASLMLGTLVVIATATVLWSLRRLGRQNAAILARLETLASSSTASQTDTDRKEPSMHSDTRSAPDFDIPGLYGGRLTLAGLLGAGRPVLLLFVSPSCGPCHALLPDIVAWQQRFAGQFMTAIISQGTLELNVETHAAFALSHIGVQDAREVSKRYGVSATPSAVLIDADGIIRRPVAGGRDQIRELVANVATSLPASAPVPTPPARTPVEPNLEDPFGSMPVSLDIGAPVPRLPLPDLDGRYVELDDFRGHDSIVLFWSPTCEFCRRMLPDLREWEEDAGDLTTRVLVIAMGSEADNRALGLRSRVLLDGGFITGDWIGAAGTPSAVRVDSDGRIASSLAVGSDAVLDLLYQYSDTVTQPV